MLAGIILFLSMREKMRRLRKGTVRKFVVHTAGKLSSTNEEVAETKDKATDYMAHVSSAVARRSIFVFRVASIQPAVRNVPVDIPHPRIENNQSVYALKIPHQHTPGDLFLYAKVALRFLSLETSLLLDREVFVRAALH